LTFVLTTATPGVTPHKLAARIYTLTGLRARTSDDFETDTVRWFLINSEDVEETTRMLAFAMLVGLGITGVMLYMFTHDNLKQYAVLKAMGATSKLLLGMVFAQTGLCAILGTGLGLGLCATIGELLAQTADFPFRMMWFTPLLGGGMVVLVSVRRQSFWDRRRLKLRESLAR